MLVAIVHYHLRPGGVTRVVQHAVRALKEKGVTVLVCVGEEDHPQFPEGTRTCIVPELAYDGTRSPVSPQVLSTSLEEAARAKLGSLPDLWHVHNHALGKSAPLPVAMAQFAERGYRILFQLHDFPEDGRPHLYRSLLKDLAGGDVEQLSKILYPQQSHVHYCVLNDRDRGFLERAGLASDRLHILPNPVHFASSAGESNRESYSKNGDQDRLFLYSGRGIRRKNIGEFLFWAAAAKDCDRFALSLEPANPLAKPVYDRWVEFARRLGLPVEFNASGRTSFVALCQEATAFVTTSVAEGFGMAFLEPWLLGRPLYGRALPEVTADFEAKGVNLSTLYKRLWVPLSWLQEKIFYRILKREFRAYRASYGMESTVEEQEQACRACVHDEHIDFARLNEAMQERCIQRLVLSPEAVQECRPACMVNLEQTGSIVASNRSCVERFFGLEQYGERLCSIYGKLLKDEEEGLSEFSAVVLLRQFLAPERFYLLRT